MSKKRKRTKKRILFFVFLAILAYGYIQISDQRGILPTFRTTAISEKPIIEEAFLTPNSYSRPQTRLKKVKGIVIHYVANPGSSAMANRNYFEGLAISGATYASSHFVVDLDGSIVQCIPLNEIAYASNGRNNDTISIEVCHPDSSGKFSKATYNTLLSLVSWLAGEYNLSSDDIIRHYDVTGKNCPKYYVENEDAWMEFKEDLGLD